MRSPDPPNTVDGPESATVSVVLGNYPGGLVLPEMTMTKTAVRSPAPVGPNPLCEAPPARLTGEGSSGGDKAEGHTGARSAPTPAAYIDPRRGAPRAPGLPRRAFLRGAGAVIPTMCVVPSAGETRSGQTRVAPAGLQPSLYRVREALASLRPPPIGDREAGGGGRETMEAARRRAVDRTLGVDADMLVTPGAVARGLLAAANPDWGSPQSWALTLRQVEYIERADHVAYHRSALGTLLARLARHYAAGTHWFGCFYRGQPSWEDLIHATIHDLKFMQIRLAGRDGLIAETGDPLTCDWEVQVSMAGWLMRLEEGGSVLYPQICGWRPPINHSESDDQRPPRTVVWFLPEGADSIDNAVAG